ncbi:MAG: DeoR/GlpR family DNA-binding transcription regulator [Treponema sp.]
MKNSRSAIFKRQNAILQKLNTHDSILIEEIAKELNVSALTIRRDLDELVEKGLAERFFGGAKLTSRHLSADPAATDSCSLHEIRKKHIAQRAALLVEEGETILINSSTTAFYMFPLLAQKHITIITNNANALQFADNSKFELVFTGGEINTYKHSMVGTFALQTLKKIRANKCFIGVSGISENGTLSTAVLQETTVNITMMNQSNNAVIILADSSKIGVQHNFDIGSLETVTHIITDSGLSTPQRDMLACHSAEIIIAE